MEQKNRVDFYWPLFNVEFFFIRQNAEDNAYFEGVDPSLEFVITSEDITATGAPATLLIFNNEKGFLSKNIDSICSVGRSTKKGNRKRGYIGEKGTIPSFLELQLILATLVYVLLWELVTPKWFIQNANLLRRILIILIGLTWKEVRTSITLVTYLFKSNIKILWSTKGTTFTYYSLNW